MAWITLPALERYLDEVLLALGMAETNREAVKRVFLFNTARGMGHHDINDFEMHLRPLLAGKVAVNPELRLLASFGCQEQWDGGNGMGAVACTHAMRRAVELAREHGMGLCAMRNTNHYLSSAPYTQLAAEQDCIGLIIAKAGPSMGLPGYRGNIVGQSPNGFAFGTAQGDTVALDGCLAYVSMHGNLNKAVAEHRKVPAWWGADENGTPTDDPVAMLKGTRYPIGEHKGFGYALLCEALTGVLSGGAVLDQSQAESGVASVMSHTAIAIRADALMSREEFLARTAELVQRVRARAEGVRIPGEASNRKRAEVQSRDGLKLDDALIERLNTLATECGAAIKL